MRTNQAVRSTPSLVDKPEKIGPALAQVVRNDENGRDLILGQAWLAAPNRLVTCGHVVEPFVQNLAGLAAFFPATGKRYVISQVRLHPSFVRQPDGLVKFDVAVLSVALTPPDSLAEPLPFSYEHSLRTNQRLWTIRFPVHLGQLSAAVQPLSQDGHFLGLLRKHDSFHLLHDVPLAPGDSGAPICDGRSVVALHCGDTATLPGLNLPTTSIRLALWIDALRELDLPETRKSYIKRASRLVFAVAVFMLTFAIAFAAASMLTPNPHSKPTAIKQPAMLPMVIKFNRALNDYEVGDSVEITLTPASACYPVIFAANQEGRVIQLFPAGAGAPQKLAKSLTIDQRTKFGSDAPSQIQASESPVKLYLLVAKADDDASQQWIKGLIKPADILDKPTGALMISEGTLLSRITGFEKSHPELVTLTKFDMPAAKKRISADPANFPKWQG